MLIVSTSRTRSWNILISGPIWEEHGNKRIPVIAILSTACCALCLIDHDRYRLIVWYFAEMFVVMFDCLIDCLYDCYICVELNRSFDRYDGSSKWISSRFPFWHPFNPPKRWIESYKWNIRIQDDSKHRFHHFHHVCWCISIMFIEYNVMLRVFIRCLT